MMNLGGPDKEYVLRFYTPLGHHPRERHTDIFIKRKDYFSGKVRVVPQMTSPRDLYRQPVPTHKLLEDDWRAYRKCAYVNARMARMEKLMGNYYSQRGMTAPKRPMVPQHLQDQTPEPTRKCNVCSVARIPQTLPKTIFSGPFQKVLPAPKCPKLRRRVGWQHQKSNKDLGPTATSPHEIINEDIRRLLHPSFAESVSPRSARNTSRPQVHMDEVNDVLKNIRASV